MLYAGYLHRHNWRRLRERNLSGVVVDFDLVLRRKPSLNAYDFMAVPLPVIVFEIGERLCLKRSLTAIVNEGCRIVDQQVQVQVPRFGSPPQF